MDLMLNDNTLSVISNEKQFALITTSVYNGSDESCIYIANYEELINDEENWAEQISDIMKMNVGEHICHNDFGKQVILIRIM